MEKFYKKYLDSCPELFYVAQDDKLNIVGFCMGYYMDTASQMQEFINENRGFIIYNSLLKLISGNKYVWRKVLRFISGKFNNSNWEIVTNKYDNLKNSDIGDLLSVCVLPDYRSKGYSQQLTTSFLSAMANSNRQLCLLSVKCDNIIARRFYERNGFEIYRTRASEGLTYAKELNINEYKYLSNQALD